jgi:hypothetical protein
MGTEGTSPERVGSTPQAMDGATALVKPNELE